MSKYFDVISYCDRLSQQIKDLNARILDLEAEVEALKDCLAIAEAGVGALAEAGCYGGSPDG